MNRNRWMISFAAVAAPVEPPDEAQLGAKPLGVRDGRLRLEVSHHHEGERVRARFQLGPPLPEVEHLHHREAKDVREVPPLRAVGAGPPGWPVIREDDEAHDLPSVALVDPVVTDVDALLEVRHVVAMDQIWIRSQVSLPSRSEHLTSVSTRRSRKGPSRRIGSSSWSRHSYPRDQSMSRWMCGKKNSMNSSRQASRISFHTESSPDMAVAEARARPRGAHGRKSNREKHLSASGAASRRSRDGMCLAPARTGVRMRTVCSPLGARAKGPTRGHHPTPPYPSIPIRSLPSQ